MSQELFIRLDFTMHSGEKAHWKIECDALSDIEIDALALMISEILPPFGMVYGIPRGGVRIAEAMRAYETYGPRLVVDDVLTTGASMLEEMQPGDIGVVLFARGVCPTGIKALFHKTQPRPKHPSARVTDI